MDADWTPLFRNIFDKTATDNAYDTALNKCLSNGICVSVATHNEASTTLALKLMEEKKIESSDHLVEFSQLLGMSDNLTFNLVHHGYRAAKYVPYGPIPTVFPYLTRRAEENSAAVGQTSRELALIGAEIHRRNR